MKIPQNKKLLIYPAVLFLLIAGGILFLTTRKQDSLVEKKEKETVRIDFPSYPNPVYIAYEKGFFDDEGLNVEKAESTGKSLSVNAIASGNVDVASAPYASLFAIQNSSPGLFKIYFGIEETEADPYSFLFVKPEIQKPQDLKGETIITRNSHAGRIQAEAIIKGLGLKLNEVELVLVAKPLIVSTFSKPEIAAAIDQDPAMTIVTDKEIGHVLVSGVRPKFIIDPFPSAAGIFNSKFVEEKPELARKVKRAIDKAIDFIDQNEDECREIFEEVLEIEPNIASKMKLSRNQKLESINREAIEKLIDFELENKTIEQKPDFADVYYQE